MKKFLFLAAITLALSVSYAQSPFIVSGKKAQFTAPRGITANANYLFPTFKTTNTVYADDTTSVTITDLETYLTIDSISQTSWLLITNASYILPGAKIFLHAEWDGTAPRTLYIKRGSAVIDTLVVADYTTDRTYVWNGSTWKSASNFTFPEYSASVTQSSSITTGVSVEGDAGVITTVSSTLAIDSNASFTVTNSFARAGSTILLTPEYTGNGSPVFSITSRSNGSFVVKLKNLGNAALNAVIRLHYLILNK